MSVPPKLMAIYIQSAAKKLAKLESLWSGHVNDDPDKTRELIDFSHQLAGSGGSYGFSDLGRAARELELQLKAMVEKDNAPDRDVVKTYESLRKELRALADTTVEE